MSWTRRRFVASGTGAALVSQIHPASGAPSATAAQQRLRSVMDEIIPKSDGMPAASEAGGLQYFLRLQQTEPEFAAQVQRAVDSLDSSVPALNALQQMERNDPAGFGLLRDFVYEAYYTQPAVWKLIGYEFHATDHPGPHMKPFDETAIANVRNKPKHYREV